MAKIYARLIVKGVKTLGDVPETIRDGVKAVLDEWGWVNAD